MGDARARDDEITDAAITAVRAAQRPDDVELGEMLGQVLDRPPRELIRVIGYLAGLVAGLADYPEVARTLFKIITPAEPEGEV